MSKPEQFCTWCAGTGEVVPKGGVVAVECSCCKGWLCDPHVYDIDRLCAYMNTWNAVHPDIDPLEAGGYRVGFVSRDDRSQVFLFDDFKHAPYDGTIKGYPPALAKAVNDPFDYALGLKDGTVIYFQQAKQNYGNEEEWVTLVGVSECARSFSDAVNQLRTPNERLGRHIDVRLSEIVWCADAPDETRDR